MTIKPKSKPEKLKKSDKFWGIKLSIMIEVFATNYILSNKVSRNLKTNF